MQIKKSRLARPAAASLSYLVTAAIGKAAALITLPFFTARLGAAGYGRYALYLCYEGIFFSIASLGLAGAGIYRALQRYPARENEVLLCAMGLSLCISLPLFLFGAFFLGGKLSPLLIAALFSEVTARVAFTLFGAKCRFRYRYLPLCLLNLCADLGAPLLSMLLLLWLPIGAEARIFSGAFVAIAIGAVSLISLLRRGVRGIDKELVRYLLSLQLPLLPHYLSVALMAEAARLCVERMLGSEALGAYAVAHSVGLALSLVTVSLGGAFQPWILRKAASGASDRVRSTTEQILLLLCTLTLPLILIAPEILSLLAPKAYAGGLAAIPALAFTVPLAFLATVPICASLSTERRWRISLASFFAAGIQLLLCPILTARFGLSGAAFGALISYFFFFLFHAVFLKKEQKQIINAKKCLLICLFFGAIGLSFSVLYPHPILRAILFFLYLFAALIQALPMRRLVFNRRRAALS